MTEHCPNNTMDNLRFVLRGDAKLYCFIEACVEVFADTSKKTVRSWLKYLDIPCVTPTAEERHYFKKNNPYLSSSIGLIFHKDMVLLREYKEDKTPRKRRRSDHVQRSAEKRKIPRVSNSSCSENEHYESTNIPPDESMTNIPPDVPTFQPTPSPKKSQAATVSNNPNSSPEKSAKNHDADLPSACIVHDESCVDLLENSSLSLDDDDDVDDLPSCVTSKKTEVSRFLSNSASQSRFGQGNPGKDINDLPSTCPINDDADLPSTSKKTEVSKFLSNSASQSRFGQGKPGEIINDLPSTCPINDDADLPSTSKKTEVSKFLSNSASQSRFGQGKPGEIINDLPSTCPINDDEYLPSTSKKTEVSKFLSNSASQSRFGQGNPGKDINDLPSTSSAKSPKKRDRSQYQLNLGNASEDLKGEIKSITDFYTKPLNSKRDGSYFSTETIKKMIERILCFMFYCKKFQNIPLLSLALFNDVDIVSEYVSHLSNVRKLMPSTIISVLTVAINVAKYNLSGDHEKLANSHEIVAYRRFQRQLSREVRLLSKRSKEGMGKKRSQEFYFAHVLEVLRNLRSKYFETSGIKKARCLHDFTMLATYLRAMPGRSQDIRSLRLHVETADTPFESCDEGNFIVFQANKSVILCQNEFKTAKSTGPTKIDLTDDSELVSYLHKHVQARSTLMLGKSHDYMFMNYRGESFKDSSTISKYIGDLFLREISIKVGTNKLRHAIVTYFKSIDESNDVNVRESLASLMKHSVRYQDEVYNDATHDTKTLKARNLMRERLTANVFGDPADFVTPKVADDSDESSDEEFNLKPKVGDVCALLDPASTRDEICFFLGKVARFADDGQEAHLMHLEEVEDSDNCYKIKPAKVWKESVKSLIFPIDIVYNNSMAVYELRTSSQDIYDACVN